MLTTRLKEIAKHWERGYWTSEDEERDSLRNDMNFILSRLEIAVGAQLLTT